MQKCDAEIDAEDSPLMREGTAQEGNVLQKAIPEKTSEETMLEEFLPQSISKASKLSQKMDLYSRDKKTNNQKKASMKKGKISPSLVIVLLTTQHILPMCCKFCRI